MTEDIPLEITSSGMANLPIFIAVLIVAAVVVACIFQSDTTKNRPLPASFGARCSSSRSAW